MAENSGCFYHDNGSVAVTREALRSFFCCVDIFLKKWEQYQQSSEIIFPRRCPVLQKTLLGVLFLSAFVAVSSAYAGKVELTTYYPVPNAEYKDLEASNKLAVPTVPKNTKTIANTTVGEIWVEPV